MAATILLRRANDILQWLAKGTLRVRVDQTFALADVAAAHRAIESRNRVGKGAAAQAVMAVRQSPFLDTRKFYAQNYSVRTKTSQEANSADLNEIGPPLSEKAYRQLRNDILRGTIEPGSKLKIEDLQRRYQYSSSPLREALSRLAAEQIATTDERRGFRAAPISLADLRDITKFRIALETSAFKESISQGTDEWEAGIISALHRLEALENALPRDSRSLDDLWIERHKGFHIALIGACGSSRMLAACSAMFDHSQRYRSLWAVRRSAPRNAGAEHRRLMDAALKRDAATGVEILRQHIQKTADQVSKFLS